MADGRQRGGGEPSVIVDAATERPGQRARLPGGSGRPDGLPTQWLTSAGDGRHHSSLPGSGPSSEPVGEPARLMGFTLPLLAAPLALGGQRSGPAAYGHPEWAASWGSLGDLYLSLWLLLFCSSPCSGCWLPFPLPAWDGSPGLRSREPQRPVQPPGRWSALLLAVCVLGLATHAGDRNGFLASSRPESGGGGVDLRGRLRHRPGRDPGPGGRPVPADPAEDLPGRGAPRA